MLASATAVSAQVTTTADSGPGSLRQALADATPGDIITFDGSLDGQVIQLLGTALTVDRSLTIDASALPAGITIDGGGNGDFVSDPGESQCLFIANFSERISVALHNLTLQNGTAPFDGGGNIYVYREDLVMTDCRILGGRTHDVSGGGGGIHCASAVRLTLDSCVISGNATSGSSATGGGIYANSCDLVFTNCTISDNFTTGGSAHGGGLHFFSSFGGPLTFDSCTFSGNEVSGSFTDGGGVNRSTNIAAQVATFTRCTIAGNTNNSAFSRGGGFSNDRGVTEFVHCTITDNTAFSGGGVASIRDSNASVRFFATIVAGNTSDDIGQFGGINNTFLSQGDNLVGTAYAVSSPIGAFNQTGDQTGVTDPQLSPLGDYGGETATAPPVNGSPAVDAAPQSSATVDQRGLPVSGIPDIGAAELFDLASLFPTDTDHDGVPYGVEVFLGTDPGQADRINPRHLSIHLTGSTPTLRFGLDAGAPVGSILRILRSTTLDAGTFTEIFLLHPDGSFTDTEGGNSFSLLEDDFTEAVFTDQDSPSPHAFYRLEVTAP